MPTHRDPSKSKPIKWGTASDVTSVDKQRAAATANATATFTKLYGKGTATNDGNRKTPVTPWLLIRYDATDIGSRPIPSSQPFWESPDIWMETPDPLGNPVPGVDNYVHARIINLGGLNAAPVKVDFYWGDPAVGLDAAHMHPIGTEYVLVASLQSTDVRCNTPWVPVFENGGHECVIVNCTSWVADPILDPFQPVLDRHVGQRNLHVDSASPGMMVSMKVQLSNLFRAETAIDLLADISNLRLSNDALQTLSTADALSAVLAFNGQNAGAAAAVRRTFDAPFIQVQSAGSSRFYGLPPLAAQSPRTGTGSARVREHVVHQARPLPAIRVLRETLQAGEQRSLNVQIAVPQSAIAGDFIVCRLYESVQNQIAGGYTAVVQVAEG